MDQLLSEDICRKMVDVIHRITNKKHKIINEECVKELQNLCSGSDNYVKRVYQLLMENLKKPHSEIRFNTFYTMNIFFNFRLSTIDSLKIILELTTEINYDLKLPPPKTAANDLKTMVLRSVKEWVQMFGSDYKKLRLCYDFLRTQKRVDFEKLEFEDEALRKRRTEEQRRKQMIAEEKLRLIRHSISEMTSEIDSVKKSLLICLKLLIPTPEQFFISEDVIEKNENLEKLNDISLPDSATDVSLIQEVDENKAKYRETGMLKGNFSIDITIPETYDCVRIKETEENSVIIENARDQYKLLNNKYLNIVKEWIKNLTALSDNSVELKRAIDMKLELENIIKKYENLIFEKEKILTKDDSESDSEMVEITPQVPSADDKLIANLKEIECQPSTSGLNLSHFKTTDTDPKNEVTSLVKAERKKKLLEIAPKLPFDVDLYHWEEENLITPMLLPVSAEGRQFWSASAMEDTDGIPNPEGTAGLRTRVIEFAGKFEPVKWSCRFPLPSGKLCPRKDRFKCPFHGPIVPRDERGKCKNPEDEKKQRELMEKYSFDDAQNPELLAQIKRETGIDLKIEKKRRKIMDSEKLTDIKQEQNTVYKRLEKKVFNKSTVKKVAKTMDNLDRKRFRDKYGDQFQYVHGTT